MYYPIIYTRTFYKDFRMICKPPAAILPMETAQDFERFIRQVLNTDKISNKPINAIRYSYLKQNNLVLWGIGCLNRDIGLKEEFCSDCKHRSNLRSFVGIVFDAEQDVNENGVPFDTSFFKLFFDKYVVPHWGFEEYKQWKIIESAAALGYNDCNVIYPLDSINVNLLRDRCNIFSPNMNIRELISSVLNKETSLVTGLNVLSHIMHAASCNVFINNAVCLEKSENTIVFFEEKKEGRERREENRQPKLLKEIKTDKKKDSFVGTIKTRIESIILKKKKDTKNKESHIDEELEEISLDNDKTAKDTGNMQKTLAKAKENPAPSSKSNVDKSLLMAWDEFGKESIAVKQETNKSLSMNWDDFGTNTESEQKLQVERAELSNQDSLKIGIIEEIGTINNIADNYKNLLSDLSYAINSVNDYKITTTNYNEIERLAHNLINKLKK